MIDHMMCFHDLEQLNTDIYDSLQTRNAEKSSEIVNEAILRINQELVGFGNKLIDSLENECLQRMKEYYQLTLEFIQENQWDNASQIMSSEIPSLCRYKTPTAITVGASRWRK